MLPERLVHTGACVAQTCEPLFNERQRPTRDRVSVNVASPLNGVGFAQQCSIDREISINGELGNGQIHRSDVELYRLCTDDDHPIALPAERFQRIHRTVRATTYRGSSTPGILVLAHPRHQRLRLIGATAGDR
jgi:hypothetical protein